jgi:hypothetical protein
MNITSLASEVTARLWELLADASIVGQAQRPASWLLDSSRYTGGTMQALGACVRAHAAALLDAPYNATPPGQPRRDSSSGSDSPMAGTETFSETPFPGQADMASVAPSGSTVNSQGEGNTIKQKVPEPAGSAAQRAHQLCSLVAAVPWERLKAAAANMASTVQPTTLESLLGIEADWQEMKAVQMAHSSSVAQQVVAQHR